ncbi:MAG: alpha/beta fold hydrolase [Actinobacteria bacterium]|nr:alpha/beta fold hydrolase [Actinomycetota bacterium]
MVTAVEAPTVQVREANLHGHKVAYRIAGSGPAIMLVHGIAGTGATWEDVMERLAGDFTLIAPDLPGHGDSDKPVGDYSLGSLASMLRDLMVTIGVEQATMVGHSLGGGVVMQFVYQFPQRCDRLVLVSSGGLGRDVNMLLRAACLPGADMFLAATAAPIATIGSVVGSTLGRFGWRPGPDLEEVARGFASLADTETRTAFLHTLKSVVGVEGQRVNASDRLYLASEMPTLLISGERDPIIPASHAEEAHEIMAGSRLVIFQKSGHMPHVDQPSTFARTLREFMENTEPAEITTERWSEVLRGTKSTKPRRRAATQ